jgi:hypothetical protein
MATQNRAIFKYRHDGSLLTPSAAAARTVTFIALVLLSAGYHPALGIFTMIAGGIVLAVTWPKKRLSLGPRYLLCGDKVVYYANVRKMELRPGLLELRSVANEVFTLDLNRFPTNARKDWKIRKNKSAKFDKVSKRIIERVLNAAPDVKCKGIDRALYSPAL